MLALVCSSSAEDSNGILSATSDIDAPKVKFLASASDHVCSPGGSS